MVSNIFLKIEGITGESKDANHKDWIDIKSFSWGCKQSANISTGGGGGAGRSSFENLEVLAHIDKATPAILKYCSSGYHLSQLELSLCKAGGVQIEYARIILEDVIVVGTKYAGHQSDNYQEMAYIFQAAKIKHQYWEQCANGGKGTEVSCGYDIKKNVVT